MVAFAKLDGPLEPNRSVAVLGASLPESDLQGAAKLLGRTKRKKSGRGRPKL